MLTLEQDREQMELVEKRKWDNHYKLPDYVEAYLEMCQKMLPNNLEVWPWTMMRCVSFFCDGKYLCSLDYDFIEDVMERIKEKESWYIKLLKRKKK